METYEFSAISGDTKSLTVYWEASDGSVYDLTGYSYELQLRNHKDSECVYMSKTAYISDEDGELGKVYVEFSADETMELFDCYNTVNKYYYALRVISSDESVVKTLLAGTLEIQNGVLC